MANIMHVATVRFYDYLIDPKKEAVDQYKDYRDSAQSRHSIVSFVPIHGIQIHSLVSHRYLCYYLMHVLF